GAVLAWGGPLDAGERLEATLETLGGLERFRGHFYNWYDTKHCYALEPKYVSSVDRANLPGHLLAVPHACEEMIERGHLDRSALAGIEDTALLVHLAAVVAVGDARLGPARHGRLAD